MAGYIHARTLHSGRVRCTAWLGSEGPRTALHNTHAATRIGAGTLSISSERALGATAAPVTIDTGTLRANAPSITLNPARTVTLAAGVTSFIDTQTNALRIEGPIAATAGSLTKVGTGTLTLAGAVGHTGATTIDAGSLVIGTAPATGSALAFGSAQTVTTVGRVEYANVDATYGGLTVQTNSGSDNVVSIATGRTLTINGDVLVSNNTDGANSRLLAAGGGSLVVSGGSFRVGLNSTGGNNSSRALLDLSALSSLTATLTNNLTVQAQGDNDSAHVASLVLAGGANTITSPTVVVGGSGTGSTNTLVLGGGTNVLNTAMLRFGSGSRDTGIVSFPGATGSLTLRGQTGTGRADITMGNTAAQTTTYSTANVLDTTGHVNRGLFARAEPKSPDLLTADVAWR